MQGILGFWETISRKGDVERSHALLWKAYGARHGVMVECRVKQMQRHNGIIYRIWNVFTKWNRSRERKTFFTVRFLFKDPCVWHTLASQVPSPSVPVWTSTRGQKCSSWLTYPGLGLQLLHITFPPPAQPPAWHQTAVTTPGSKLIRIPSTPLWWIFVIQFQSHVWYECALCNFVYLYFNTFLYKA